MIPYVIRNDSFCGFSGFLAKLLALGRDIPRGKAGLSVVRLFSHFSLSRAPSRRGPPLAYDPFSIRWTGEKGETGRVGFAGFTWKLYGKHLRFSVKVTGRSLRVRVSGLQARVYSEDFRG